MKDDNREYRNSTQAMNVTTVEQRADDGCVSDWRNRMCDCSSRPTLH
ncbi:hypothetical protein M0D69_30340 [Caballeronia sp. SEWSISQ10-4 2]|nr:hypothetical protein [Caballeronia sp. SEWSISQ10-4 2]MDN7182241.1 hypothetical protein [Caballeronia sp. SEWSISQ10-4 2]